MYYGIFHEIEARVDFHVTWALPMTGIPIAFAFREEIARDAFTD